MSRIYNTAIVVILALMFVVCIYLNSDYEVFSTEKYLNNITRFSDAVSIDGLLECWTQDYYYEELSTYVSTGGGISGMKNYYETYEGEEELFIFFDSVKGFFLRLFRFLKLFCEMIVNTFTNLDCLLPWNATVPKGVI